MGRNKLIGKCVMKIMHIVIKIAQFIITWQWMPQSLFITYKRENSPVVNKLTYRSYIYFIM